MDNFIMASSGNVYKDLGYANADTMKMKAEIVSMISDSISEKLISLEYLSSISGITVSVIEDILRGHFREIDYSQLLHLLSTLGNDIEIRVKPSIEKCGKVIVA